MDRNGLSRHGRRLWRVSAILGAVVGLLVVVACVDTPLDPPDTKDEAATQITPTSLAMGNGKGGGGGGGNNKPADPENVSTTFPKYLANGEHNDFVDDGKGAYLGGICGVKSFVQDNVDTHFYSFRPVDNGLSRKAQRDLDRGGCADFPRTFKINITDSTMVHDPDADPGDHSLDLPLGQVADSSKGTILHPDTVMTRGISAAVGQMLPDTTGDFFVGGSFNVKYCILDGSGPPFLFNTSREPESDSLLVTRDGFTDFQVSTQPDLNNVGHCVHTVNGVETVLLLHMNLAYTVTAINPL